MPGRNNKALRIAAGVAVSFTALIVAILALVMQRVVSFQLGLLMLIALFGLYLGFGVLIMVYRFTARLK